MLLLLVLLLLLQNVLGKLRQPVDVVQSLEIFIVGKLLFEVLPLCSVTQIPVLHGLA